MKLYHYCSFETLFSIVKNKKLWLSDLSKSNDENEDLYLFNLFSDFIKSEEFSFGQTCISFNSSEFERARKSTKIFGISFTELEDDPWMWTNYCGAGGVRLEFDLDEISAWLSCFKVYSESESITLKKVNYYSNYQSLHCFFEGMLKEFENITGCYLELANSSPLIKTCFWKHEKEWRIYLRLLGHNSIKNMFLGEDVKCDYHVKNNMPILHFELPFCLRFIKSIVISPNSYIDPKELEFMLNAIVADDLFSCEPADGNQIGIETSKYSAESIFSRM